MHLWTTNSFLPTFDVYRFSFELAGALVIVNEYSGLAVHRLTYIAFADLKLACPLGLIHHAGDQL
jgi:hypothetical protein